MTQAGAWPRVIQGGMGVAVSGWRLASTVSRMGQLGVVSGTALAVVLARGLQDGDRDGDLRRGLSAFVDRAVAARIQERYFRRGGRRAGGGYRAVPVPRQRPSRHFLELTVAGSFVEVYLAKEGHGSPVGINLLEKIQIPTLPSLYGAMLAGVDWVLMGAGIPLHIPAALEALADHRPVSLPLAVVDATAEDDYTVAFDPRSVVAEPGEALSRPRFMAIVGSHVLATHLARDDKSRPAGFVVERPIAGGHNAPPRGALRLSAEGEPVYGPRDDVDLARMRQLGLPFWLAGGYAHPLKLREALGEGASGVQIGTAFALCEESGLDPALKRRAREQAAAGRLVVHTDPAASPTGYPFKVARVPGTVADPEIHAARRRRCDLSYLTTPYRQSDGKVGYRCPAEPVHDYLAKGGQARDTVGRMCLCNGLVAAVGLPQRRQDGGAEPPLLTLGDDACAVLAALSPDGRSYRAKDVVRHVLDGGVPHLRESAVHVEALEVRSDLLSGVGEDLPPENETRLRVMVVDHDDFVHWGFRLILGQMSWVERCVSARTGAEAVAACRRYEPHVALVDLFLGDESGLEICERLRAEASAPRVLLTSGARGISPRAARGAGAAGFISKDWPATEIARMVRIVGDGKEVFRESTNPAVPSLTDRESEILGLIAGGATNREIAGSLYLSPHTVKEHTSTLYRKLGARSRADAIQRAQRLVCLPEEGFAADSPDTHRMTPHLGGTGAVRASEGTEEEEL